GGDAGPPVQRHRRAPPIGAARPVAVAALDRLGLAATVSVPSTRTTPAPPAARRVPQRRRPGTPPWEDELFRHLAVSAPAGLVVVDTDGTVRLRNDEASRILGDVDRLPEPLLAVLDQETGERSGHESAVPEGAIATAYEPVVVERGLRRLEVE